MDKESVEARMRGEQARTIWNIAARTECPETAFWLSFADDDGFRGAVIVHAEDFMTAVMECNLRGINPHGECKGLQIPGDAVKSIPEKWKNRVLSREECAEFDAEMWAAGQRDGTKEK